MPPRLPEATTLREISYQASRLSTRLRVRLPTTAASPALTLIDPVFSNIGKTGPFPQAWASLILAIVAIFVTTPVFVGPRPSHPPSPSPLPPPPPGAALSRLRPRLSSPELSPFPLRAAL